ncbi:MAG: hypothetical protein KAJ19_12985 [Gammaproteobacteria bacterium]|nr:hypothetical protein [Gammaproteobacteria bacterium]
MGGDPAAFRQSLMRNSYDDAVSLYLADGVTSDDKFGHCPDAAAAKTDIWEQGLSIPEYIFPAPAGELIEVFSDNPADAGIEITINGLDSLGFRQEETLACGTIALPTPSTLLWRATNRSACTNGIRCQGLVIIQGDGSTSTNIFATIAPDDQQTSQAIFMVPVDEVVLVKQVMGMMNKSGTPGASAIFTLDREVKDGVFRSIIRFGLQRDGNSAVPIILPASEVAPPLARLKMTAFPSNADMDVSARFDMKFFKTEWLGLKVVNELQRVTL